MYYDEELDENSPEYQRVLAEEKEFEENLLDLFAWYNYALVINSGTTLCDEYIEAPRYATLARRHGGIVATYSECVRRNCHIEDLLGYIKDLVLEGRSHTSSLFSTEYMCGDPEFDGERINFNIIRSYINWKDLYDKFLKEGILPNEELLPIRPFHPVIQYIIDEVTVKGRSVSELAAELYESDSLEEKGV